MRLNKALTELATYPQWVVWSGNKVPHCARTGKPANVIDSTTWSTYSDAVEAVQSDKWSGLGFVLTDDDPFAFIDLDATDNPEIIKLQTQIYDAFPSYAEISPSGKGCHILVRGSVPKGKRKGKIEIYSSQRYFTVTGNVAKDRDLPISDHDEQLNKLWTWLGGDAGSEPEKATVAVSEGAAITDQKLMTMALNATNVDKFKQLWAGEWQGEYPSQSEADFALINMLGFYSNDAQQIMRLFRNSTLGERQKAQRDNYLMPMINKVMADKPTEIDLEKMKLKFIKKIEPTITPSSIKNPPGLIGEIAKYIMEQSPRPVHEIALVGAIGLLAGICGRSYNVSNTGLNQYMLLLANTGTGKEAISTGVEKLMQSVYSKVPAAEEFIGPGEFASGTAMIKYMAKGRLSFASIVGEFGIFMQQMGHEMAPSHIAGLKKFILDTYSKSGQGGVFRPKVYADRDNNTASLRSPAFTLIGESAPEPFYEGLHEGMVMSGLLPRFTILRYSGDKPKFNRDHYQAVLPPELTSKIADLCARSLSLNQNNECIHIALSPEADAISDRYRNYCDSKDDDELSRAFFSRNHIQALKLAALLAVGVNPYHPCITPEELEWAISVINNGAEDIMDKFRRGDVGANSGESQQHNKLRERILKYFKTPVEKLKTPSYKPNSKMYKDYVIPYAWIHNRSVNDSTFKNDRMGATNAIKRTLKSMVDTGELIELSKLDTEIKYKTKQLCYKLTVD